DDIIIHNADSLKLDSLRYMSDWGGSKIALERRSVGAPALQPNFADAPNGLGTPGSKNQIEKDTTPPKQRYVNVTNSKIITLKFSEQLSAGTAFKTDNYIFKPNILIDKITFSNRMAILRLEQPLKPEKEYTLTVK